ncbi:hypothetical protein SAMN05446037_101321 [Anaerovirgula multivorans]|uniref:Uncharacterized protein n=1 Tax=Anaerovirgula multivorans TaxID=312168 RepID=A0A239FHS2_9FIRM|nr:hypothetical protein SAMN05446037_101321 [Anaerovirgula multivorans]
MKSNDRINLTLSKLGSQRIHKTDKGTGICLIEKI